MACASSRAQKLPVCVEAYLRLLARRSELVSGRARPVAKAKTALVGTFLAKIATFSAEVVVSCLKSFLSRNYWHFRKVV